MLYKTLTNFTQQKKKRVIKVSVPKDCMNSNELFYLFNIKHFNLYIQIQVIHFNII